MGESHAGTGLMDHADVRYLEAKRTVDERALSRRVRAALRSELPAAPRVLEAGCGTGVTVPRLLDWGVDAGRYLGVDRDERVVAHARDARVAELRSAGREVERTPRGGRVGECSFAFEVGDALDVFGSGDPFAEGDDSRAVAPDRDAPGADGADLLVAQAFLDLVPPAAAVPSPVTVGVAAALAAAALHAASDRLGAGEELRPWERTNTDAVYDHVRGRWLTARYVVPYDGSPRDLLATVALAVPVVLAYDGPVRWLVAGLVAIAAAYTLLRRRLVPYFERFA